MLLSSHDIAGLERVCDHLVILDASRVRLEGDIAEVLRSHRRLVGSAGDSRHIANVQAVIEASRTGRQTSLLARVGGPILDPSWDVLEATLEDVVLAYLASSSSGSDERPRPSLEVAR